MNLKNNNHLKLPGDQTECNYKSFSKRTKFCPVPSDFLKNNAPHEAWVYATVKHYMPELYFIIT